MQNLVTLAEAGASIARELVSILHKKLVNPTLALYVLSSCIEIEKSKLDQKAATSFVANHVKQFGEIPYFTLAISTVIGVEALHHIEIGLFDQPSRKYVVSVR